jgi:hypothetical protein
MDAGPAAARDAVVAVPDAAESRDAMPGALPDAAAADAASPDGSSMDAADAAALDGSAPLDAASADGACPGAGGGSPGLTMIATSTRPLALALDRCNVYWVDQTFGGLMSVPKTGGPKLLVAPGTPAPPGDGMSGLAVVSDGQTIYWSEYVAYASAGGESSALGSGDVIATNSAGVSTRLWSGSRSPSGLAVGQGYLYLLADKVLRVPLPGGPAETLSEQGGAFGIALAGSNVYWTPYNLIDDVLSVPRTGGPTSIVSVGHPTMPCGGFSSLAITADARNIYWGDLGEAVCWGTIYAQPLAGGSPRVLVGDAIEPEALVVDGNSLYATTGQSGTILEVDLSSGTVTTLASGQSWPSAIAVDETSIYWANNNGDQTGIMRLPKP